MSKSLLFVALALVLCIPLEGCTALRSHSAVRRAKRAIPVVPILVGTVTLVDEEGRFVLIDSGTSPSPAPGALLKSRPTSGDGAELKAGAIRKRPFAIADVVKGTPRVGDQVFQQP